MLRISISARLRSAIPKGRRSVQIPNPEVVLPAKCDGVVLSVLFCRGIRFVLMAFEEIIR
jgi:hypothetical protein